MSDHVPPGFTCIQQKCGFGIGFGPIYLHGGTCTLGFRVAGHHLNPAGGCHGGAIATFADHQIAAVRHLLGDSTAHLPTVSITIDYFAPAQEGDWIEAPVILAKTTRTLVFTQAIITLNDTAIGRSNAIYRNYISGPQKSLI